MEKQRTVTWEIMGVRVTNLPVSGTGEIESVHAEDLKRAEIKVARVLVREGFPFRGEEVRFIRKLLGLSLEKFAAQFGLTGSGVRKWEEEKRKVPLDPILQVALRVFFASRLNIQLPTDFTQMKGREKAPKNLKIDYQTEDTDGSQSFSQAS